MRKIIAIVKDNPRLKEKFDALEALEKNLRDRIAFLQRQADKVCEEATAAKTEIWKDIDGLCESEGLLPDDYVEGKYHKHFDQGLGILSACNEVDAPQNFVQFMTGQ